MLLLFLVIIGFLPTSYGNSILSAYDYNTGEKEVC